MIRSLRRLALVRAVLATAILAAAVLAPLQAAAQPAPLTTTLPQTWRSYGAAITFTPATTATADFLTITGPSAVNSVVRVTRLECYGTSTGAALLPISVIKRSAIPTVAGTSTSPTAVSRDSVDTAAPTAVVRAYTVAPTPGAAVGTIANGLLFSTVVGTAAQTIPLIFNFLSDGTQRQGVTLRSGAVASTEVLALNTTAVAGQSMTCNVAWTEAP